MKSLFQAFDNVTKETFSKYNLFYCELCIEIRFPEVFESNMFEFIEEDQQEGGMRSCARIIGPKSFVKAKWTFSFEYFCNTVKNSLIEDTFAVLI